MICSFQPTVEFLLTLFVSYNLLPRLALVIGILLLHMGGYGPPIAVDKEPLTRDVWSWEGKRCLRFLHLYNATLW